MLFDIAGRRSAQSNVRKTLDTTSRISAARPGAVQSWFGLCGARYELKGDSTSHPMALQQLEDEGVGSTRDGQAVPYDELRARVVI